MVKTRLKNEQKFIDTKNFIFYLSWILNFLFLGKLFTEPVLKKAKLKSIQLNIIVWKLCLIYVILNSLVWSYLYDYYVNIDLKLNLFRYWHVSHIDSMECGVQSVAYFLTHILLEDLQTKFRGMGDGGMYSCKKLL